MSDILFVFPWRKKAFHFSQIIIKVYNLYESQALFSRENILRVSYRLSGETTVKIILPPFWKERVYS